MQAILTILACTAAVTAYVVLCRRKDCRADREHQAVITAMSPGPKIRELTTVRPNPMLLRKLASGSQLVFPATSAGDFGHVPTDYGTYTPAEVNAAILGRADTDTHHHHATSDTPYGGFDGVEHLGH